MGSAESNSETLHPTTDAVQVPMINFVALGTLEDANSFIVRDLGDYKRIQGANQI